MALSPLRGDRHGLSVDRRGDLFSIRSDQDIAGECSYLLPNLGAPARAAPKRPIAGINLERQTVVRSSSRHEFAEGKPLAFNAADWRIHD